MKNIIAIFDGIGNQMFHYARALSVNENMYPNDYIAHKHSNYGACLFLAFGIKTKNKFADNMLVRFVRKCVVFSLKKHFPVITLPLLNLLGLSGIRVITDYNIRIRKNRLFKPFITVYCGRFQNEKYFKNIEAEVKQAFSFNPNKVSEETRVTAGMIANENSVSIHVRRGDYLNKQNLALFENISTLSYYNKAIEYILAHVENPVFYVFSDDIPWTKENLKLPNAFFVDWNFGVRSWEDLFLMTLCKHNIIANSTFSWWGAWLNKNEYKIVLCPPKYTNKDETDDFFPNTWHKIYTE
jgi:hypothetical protein